MKFSRILTAVAATAVVAFAGPAISATIDFETVPGGSPADKLVITNQYLSTFGVTFSLSNGSNPTLEKTGTGDTGNGFLNDAKNQYDVEADSAAGELGDYFLRIGTAGLVSTPVPSLIIDYSTAVAAASGQIWDIDGHSNGTEQWQITALDGSGGTLSSITSPLGQLVGGQPTPLDGLPWTWSFDLSESQIAQIQVMFVGSKTRDIGLAFDNFSPSSPSVVPVPAALPLFLSGLVGLSMIARRRNRSA